MDRETAKSKDSAAELRTSMTLVREAQAFDEQAWAKLVKTYTPLISLWCAAKGIQGHDAGDCCQEVFLRASRTLPNFAKKTPSDSFRGWLRTITYVVAADYYRQKYNRPLPVAGSSAVKDVAVESLESALTSRLHVSERYLLAKRVMDIVSQDFSKRQTEAFINVVIHQRPPSEVAAELKTTVNFVYKAKCRILAKIRTLFPEN